MSEPSDPVGNPRRVPKPSGDRSSSPTSRALDAVIAEAKDHLDVRDVHDAKSSSTKDALGEMDWSRLEARLMAAVEKEKPPLLRDVELRVVGDASSNANAKAPRSRDRLLRVGAVVLAAAAAVALFVHKDRDDRALPLSADAVSQAQNASSASALRSTEGTGDVRINTVVATPGYVLRAGDAIDVDGARAVFERSRKVSWLLEQDRAPAAQQNGEQLSKTGAPVAHAHVKSAGESLILGLENGVIEAQVVPVPTGEAFAVDVATDHGVVRVAVHGTHLRVARAGNRVVVDLTEGVVSIGVPPRTGVTYGTLVTAPAHVELDATDLSTLRVDHTASAVRSAVPLGIHEAVAARPETPSAPQPTEPPTPPAAVAATQRENNNNNKSAGAVARPTVEIAPPKAVLPPREAIMTGIRECATSVKNRHATDGVRVTVNSSLRLKVSPSGVVESAQFSPPLLPDVQTCAAQVIYKTKLEETGLVTIPIEFSY